MMRKAQKAAAAMTALALAAVLAVPVWADNANNEAHLTATTNAPTDSAEINVKATYQPEDVYHVDIAWQSMEFTYTPGVWMGTNATTHDENETMTYLPENDTEMGWNNNNGNNIITVTNKSNVDIGVNFDFEFENKAKAGCEGRVSASFYDANAKVTLLKENSTTQTEGAVGDIWMERADKQVITLEDGNKTSKDVGKASEAKIHLILSGRPKYKLDNDVIGTVTIKISADNGGEYSLYYESGAVYTGSSGNKPVSKRSDLGYGGTSNVPRG